MKHRDRFSGWWGRVMITTLALLVLAAGLCLFDPDQDHDGAVEHVDHLDLCFLALVTPGIAPSIAVGLLLFGFAMSTAGLALVTVALPVPYPPPRRFLLA